MCGNDEGCVSLVVSCVCFAVLGDTVSAIRCDPNDPESECNEREQKYISKVKEWTTEKQQSEVGRVHTILQKPMTDDLRDWARRRAQILNLLLKAKREGGGEL